MTDKASKVSHANIHMYKSYKISNYKLQGLLFQMCVFPFPEFSFPTWRNKNPSEVSSGERDCVSVQTGGKILPIQSPIIGKISFNTSNTS